MARRSSRGQKMRKRIVGLGAQTYELTKIDVAQALIRTAVRLFFEDAHPVPIYLQVRRARF